MAIPTFVGVGSFEDTGSGASAFPTLPAGWQADDMFYCFAHSRSNQPAFIEAGWTPVSGSPISNRIDSTGIDDVTLSVWQRRATSSESAPEVTGGYNHLFAQVAAIRGTVSGDPTNAYNTDFNASKSDIIEWNSATTTESDCLVLGFAAFGDPGPFAILNSGNLSSVTERADNTGTTGDGGCLYLMTGEKASSGATGVASAQQGTGETAYWASITLAVRGAGSPSSNPSLVIPRRTRYLAVR